MSDDEMELDRWIEEARTTYHPPPAPPMTEMWDDIEARAFGRRRASGPRRWVQAGAGIAAALVLGFALGRGSVRGPAAVPSPVVAAEGAVAQQPYDRTATTLLGQTVVLLSALPADARDVSRDRKFATQASDLLVTTRLLLDSQAAADPRLHDLLEDLELILAQIARIQHGQDPAELRFITEALQERDLVPRIRALAAELAAAD
jgi:hypothetical protein